MTFRTSAKRSHAIGTEQISENQRKNLRPIHRGPEGPHPLRTVVAVVTGSAIALCATLVLQSGAMAQLAPSSIRAAGSFGTAGAAKPALRVEANKLTATPISLVSAAIAQVSNLAAAGPVRANAALPSVSVPKPYNAVIATGVGPLDPNGDVASVQLASIIEGMPDGDLGPLVLASGAITLNARSRDDIANGQVDQRILAMLLAVSFDHQIEITVLRSGHNKYVKGTKRLSNHVSGRAVDIGMVDGRLVRQSNKSARLIVDQLLALPGPIRPTEIGSPWNTDDPETFTDSGHDNHLHIGFDS